MPLQSSQLLTLSKLFLVILALFLQLIAICTSWWAQFNSQTDLGKPRESGHYGLWSLCSTKGPRWVEDCDPLDTFFQLPPYSKVSGVVGTLHVLVLLAFIPLGTIRHIQISKNLINYGIKTKAICITELVLCIFSTIFSTLVAVFISIGENQKEYLLFKGWSFWMQISIIIINIIITSLCSFEGIRILQQHLRQQIDPTGKRAETYGNPSFDAESPELSRVNHSTNGVHSSHSPIAFTESSGHPYNLNPLSNSRRNKSSSNKNSSETSKNSFQTLTYENECYAESSPTFGRANVHRQ